MPDRLLADIRAVPGFRGLGIVHANPRRIGMDPADPRPWAPGLVVCTDLVQIPVIGRCSAGAAVAAVPVFAFLDLQTNNAKQWPAAAISPEQAATLPV